MDESTRQEVIDQITDDVPVGNGTSPGILEALKQRRQELLGERHLDMEIPGYDSVGLVARYRPVPWDELKKIANRAQRNKTFRRELVAQADTIIASCDELFIRQRGELVPMSRIIGVDFPVSFSSPELAQALGFVPDPQSPARSIVLGVFNNDLAISNHHNELIEWMQNTTTEVDEEFVGES